MTEQKGLLIFVYRPADRVGDTTNGGVSNQHKSLVVVGTKKQGDKTWTPLDRQSQVFKPSEDSPAVILVESRVPELFGPHLEPVGERPEGHVGPMAGGNYAGGSDSRWGELGLKFGGKHLDTVPVHDRFETQALYNLLSRD